MKKPEPELSCFGGGRLSSPSAPPFGTISNGKFSKPGIERFSAWISTFEVTWIETTAGETRSKISANDSGDPGGGAKIGAVEALIRLPPWGAVRFGSFIPAPAMAATATLAPPRAPTTNAVLLTAI